MSKIDHHLFSAHEHAFEREPCPQCGAELVIRQGKHGPFLGCSAYPACDYIRSLTPSGRDIEKVLEGSACPDCGQPLAIKKGRYGLFVGCTQYPLVSTSNPCRRATIPRSSAPSAARVIW